MKVRSAVLSGCGVYRYRLDRIWSDALPLVFVMLNPSIADASVDDPTIRRCIGFARREGAGGIIVVNLFAYRATNPANLPRPGLSEGAENERHILAVLAAVPEAPIICAWGAHPAFDYGEKFIRWASDHGASLFCLGVTKRGAPRHPLYLRADAPLLSLVTAGRQASDNNAVVNLQKPTSGEGQPS